MFPRIGRLNTRSVQYPVTQKQGYCREAMVGSLGLPAKYDTEGCENPFPPPKPGLGFLLDQLIPSGLPDAKRKNHFFFSATKEPGNVLCAFLRKS